MAYEFSISNTTIPYPNPELASFLTNCGNELGRKLTNKEIDFCKRAYAINVLSRRAFSTDDMKPVCKSNGVFRQMIHKLTPLLEITVKSIPTWYKFKGLTIDQKLTKKYTELTPTQRVRNELDTRLATVKHEPPMIHNIRIKLETSGLYNNLVTNYPYQPNSQNKIFFLTYEIQNYTAKVSVYPTDSVVVNIACTYSPIEYSTNGFLRLSFLLGKIPVLLDMDSKTNNIIQDVDLWRFTHFDLNRDSVHFDCDFPLHDVYGHVQMYTKKMLDKSTVFRVEEQ